MSAFSRCLPVAAGLGLLAGCQTARPLYYWGEYEALTYQGYIKPEKAPADVQIAKLEADLEKAKGANLQPHPGLHAYLGYLYYRTGKEDRALQHFETERRLFPESERFIQTVLGSAKAEAQRKTPAQTE